MITSTGNQNVKEVVQLRKKSKARSKEGVFLVEGIRMIQEVPPERLKKLYVTEHFYEKYRDEFELLKNTPKGAPGNIREAQQKNGAVIELVADHVFEYMSDTKTPQGVLGIVAQARYELEDVIAPCRNLSVREQAEKEQPPHVIVLDNLQDPGNLGTIFRTAEAAGVSGIILSKDCVDIYNPKTIRSTMGAVYRMPFLYADDLKTAIAELKARGIRVYAAHLDGKNTYDKEAYCGGTAFLIGNEGNGLRAEIAECADCWIRIPMAGQAESLNAAVAASILMYEVNRQRRDNHQLIVSEK